MQFQGIYYTFGKQIARDSYKQAIPDDTRKGGANAMFVNCYDGYGLCLFTARVKEGVQAKLLGRLICCQNDLVDFWRVTEQPEGAIVIY